MPEPIRIIDSHTGGEPTRTLISGGPDLGDGDMATLRERMAQAHDHWRRALILEPRGSEVLVGAYLRAPKTPGDRWGVIFFNNVGYLGMCGHGTIGVVATLKHLGWIDSGTLAIDTPVGTVQTQLHEDGSVTVANVPAWRYATGVPVRLADGRLIHGDIAWGGNWFFLCSDHGQDLTAARWRELTAYAQAVRNAIEAAGLTGADGAVIDHIELLGPPADPSHHGRNFVLCPGGVYDRSPCGTGTSAKLACLAADGALQPGAIWRQESVLGSVFEAHYETAGAGHIHPFIRGRAHITLDAHLHFDPRDDLRWGF